LERDKVIDWRKLHNEQLHYLYYLPNIIRTIKSRSLRLAGHVAHVGVMRDAYKNLLGNPEEKGPISRPRRRWDNNIKMDVKEIGLESLDWIHMAQDRDRRQAAVNTIMNLRVP
jgi:hypothetical protein